MRFGYSAWGFLGDVKLDAKGNSLSTPDGNATYSWSILWEAQRRGWKTYWMQEDRDLPAFIRLGADAVFGAFSPEKRLRAYQRTLQTDGSTFPELDILLLEWRFPVPTRNCRGDEPNVLLNEHGQQLPHWRGEPPPPGLQPDLYRQWALLGHYKSRGTKILLWDLDHKLTKREEEIWNPDAIFETSVKPQQLRLRRTRVEPPICVEDLLQFPTLVPDQTRKLVYIGSRYERDQVIDEWVHPVAQMFPGEVHFYGKWEPGDEVRRRWPGIVFHDRCTVRDFRDIYGTAGGCPLLAKPSYFDTGFITPRPWEALMFGTLPIGLRDALGVDQYSWEVAGDGQDLAELAELCGGMDPLSRAAARSDMADELEFMDVRHFVDRIEEVT